MNAHLAGGLACICIFAVYVALVAWLGSTGKIKRNYLLGFRAPFLYRSERAWRAGNRAARPVAVGGAAIIVVGSVVVGLSDGFGAANASLYIVGSFLCGTVLASAALASLGAYRAEREENKWETESIPAPPYEIRFDQRR